MYSSENVTKALEQIEEFIENEQIAEKAKADRLKELEESDDDSIGSSGSDEVKGDNKIKV